MNLIKIRNCFIFILRIAQTLFTNAGLKLLAIFYNNIFIIIDDCRTLINIFIWTEKSNWMAA